LSERKEKELWKKVKKISNTLILNFLNECRQMDIWTRLKLAKKILFSFKNKKQGV
jgi:hypothetical protein